MRARRRSFWPVYAVDASCVGRSPAGGTADPVVAFFVSAESKTGNARPYISTTEAACAEPASASAAAKMVLRAFILLFPSRIVYLPGSFTSANLSNSMFQYSLPRFSTLRM